MKRLLGNVALSVVVSVAFLAVVEGTARLLEKPRPAKKEVADYIWDWDEKMPGGFYVMRSEGVGWPPTQEINGDGLRDVTRPREKPAGVWRVAVLGDSVTLGDGLRPYESYPRVLEARLHEAGQRIEVMNVALWGWSTRQERIAWQRIARGYHPDQAILAVCLNDIPELHNNLTRPPRWLVRLHERSALVRLIVGAEGREIENVERLFETPLAPRVREALDGFFEEVRLLRSEVEADGATFAVVVFPFRFQTEEGAPTPVVQEGIASFCGAEGLTCLDMLPVLREIGPSAFSDYDHLSHAGSVATAEALLASGLLPQGYSNVAALEGFLRGRGDERARGVLVWLDERASPLGDAGRGVLAEALGAPEAPVRMAAAWALETLGAGGVSAEPALLGALRGDPEPGVRAAAARALGALEPTGGSAVAVLFEALDDPHEAVRHAAARALSDLGLSDAEIPRLERALRSGDPYVVAFAAWRLGNLGERARPAVPALVETLDQPGVYAVTFGALARIGPAAVEAVPALVTQLQSPDDRRRWRAAKGLGRIGHGAAGGVPALIAAMEDDPSEWVRAHAARALGRIRDVSPSTTAALQGATGDGNGWVRREAGRALERLQKVAADLAGPQERNEGDSR
ncbi:MAG: HEAT repeat domain-containing protein [Acidobacteria bacterium]|nr:HEAT repeat domain-containing protein [Acidobacteriota bacterium]